MRELPTREARFPALTLGPAGAIGENLGRDVAVVSIYGPSWFANDKLVEGDTIGVDLKDGRLRELGDVAVEQDRLAGVVASDTLE